MAEHLELDILRPQGRLDLRGLGAKGPVEANKLIMVEGVELPAALGEMGVRPRHIPFLTPLVPGVVRYRYDGEDHRIAVSAGFVEISESGVVTVLTERAVRSWEVDVAKAREERDEIAREIQKHPTTAITDPALIELFAKRDWLEAQLRAAQA